MTSPFATYPVPEKSFMPSGSSNAARGSTPATRGTGAKRGRKPKAAAAAATPAATPAPTPTTSQSTDLQWMGAQPTQPAVPSTDIQVTPAPGSQAASLVDGRTGVTPSSRAPSAAPGVEGVIGPAGMPPPGVAAPGGEEDADAEDEFLPAMADDDYSAQLSWQSQSKDNLKVLMDNFGPAQYDRFEAYRRHALPKQAVRKVIQQTLSQQVSQPVAQIVAGFAKVFVGEMVERARRVQEHRKESGPLTPDHLREAYRVYQNETGRVGAARPLRSKRLFVR